MKFGVLIEVDECYMTVCHETRSRVMIKVVRCPELEILPFSPPTSSTIYIGR